MQAKINQTGLERITNFVNALHTKPSIYYIARLCKAAELSFADHNLQFAVIDIAHYHSRTSCYESMMLGAECFDVIV